MNYNKYYNKYVGGTIPSTEFNDYNNIIKTPNYELINNIIAQQQTEQLEKDTNIVQYKNTPKFNSSADREAMELMMTSTTDKQKKDLIEKLCSELNKMSLENLKKVKSFIERLP